MSIQESRQRTISALRENRRGFTQIRERYTDQANGRCACGLVMEEFGVDPATCPWDEFDQLRDQLGMKATPDYEPEVLWNDVYNWNDEAGMSYAEIAGRLEREWRISE